MRRAVNLGEEGEACKFTFAEAVPAWSLRSHWRNLNTPFSYPEDIRQPIYTTNAIESLNSVIRQATKKRKLFPSDDSAGKVGYLVWCNKLEIGKWL